MGVLSELHARPPEDWLPGPLHARRDLNELYHNSHYEPSSYGGTISALTSEFPSDSPHGYTVQAQHVLREPVTIGSHLVFGQSAQGPPAVEPEPTMDDVDAITAETHEDDVEQEEVEQDEGGVLYGVSQGPYGYLVQPTGVPDDHGMCIPDFVIDQRNGQDEWRYVSLIEMKATHTFTKGDLFRFSRYAERLRSIHRAGLDVGNVIMMLIAGGRVYTWGIDEWPADQLTMRQVQERPYVRMHQRRFITLLRFIRDLPWVPSTFATGVVVVRSIESRQKFL